MSAEKTNQTLTLKDGRTLGFAEYGDASSPKTVIYFNGSGGSRLEHPADEQILTDLGVRFIATDRPGHGFSSPQAERTLLDWPNDIGELTDHLGAGKFYVIGWSGGGPHALACAYKLPERVIAGAIISGLAPIDRPNPYEGLPFMLKVLNYMGRRTPGLVYFFRRLMSSMIQGDPDEVAKKLAASFPPVDQKIALEPENQKMLVASIQEGYTQGAEGPAQDDLVINGVWGFDLKDVGVRIDIWQGEVDKNVPLIQGQYQHEQIPNSTFTLMPDQAHLYLLENWRIILEKLVA